MNNIQNIANSLIIALIAGLVIYWVIFAHPVVPDQLEEAAIERNVARNAQYPQTVAWPPLTGNPYKLDRICPAGSARFTAGDYNCNVCHHLAENMQELSEATHHYTNIAGKASSEPFPDPQLPGYSVMLPTAQAEAPPIIWGAKSPHGNRGTCTSCHAVM